MKIEWTQYPFRHVTREGEPSGSCGHQMASARIRLDNPRIGSAPCTTAGCMGAVGVPVWMWVDGGLPTRTATASVQGVSVTVTARMDRVD